MHIQIVLTVPSGLSLYLMWRLLRCRITRRRKKLRSSPHITASAHNRSGSYLPYTKIVAIMQIARLRRDGL